MTVKMTKWLFAALICFALSPAAARADAEPAAAGPVMLESEAMVARGDAVEQQLIAVVMAARELEDDDARLATALNALGAFYHDNGQLAEAEPFYRMALSLAMRTYGPDHLDVAVYLANLATLYQDLGREDEATPLFERALGIWSAPEETI